MLSVFLIWFAICVQLLNFNEHVVSNLNSDIFIRISTAQQSVWLIVDISHYTRFIYEEKCFLSFIWCKSYIVCFCCWGISWKCHEIILRRVLQKISTIPWKNKLISRCSASFIRIFRIFHFPVASPPTTLLPCHSNFFFMCVKNLPPPTP